MINLSDLKLKRQTDCEDKQPTPIIIEPSPVFTINFAEYLQTLKHKEELTQNWCSVFKLENETGFIFQQIGPWIAGGSLLRMITNEYDDAPDFDIYFKNEHQLRNTYTKLINIGWEYIQSNDLTISLEYTDAEGKTYKIQLITFMFFESPAHIFTTYDFNVCKIAYDGKIGYFGANTLNDIAHNKLDITENTHLLTPALSMKRVLKYLRRGYFVTNNTIDMLFAREKEIVTKKSVSYFTFNKIVMDKVNKKIGVICEFVDNAAYVSLTGKEPS